MQNACYISCMHKWIPAILLFFSILSADVLLAQEKQAAEPFGQLMADSVHDAWHASLADDGEGRFFCAWSERSVAGTRILSAFLRPFQQDGFTISENVPWKDSCEAVRPAVAWMGGGNVLLAWQEGCKGRQRILGRVFDEHGTAMGAVFPVSEGSWNAMMPSAGSNRSGEVLIAWQDFRNGVLDVFAQRYDSEGTPIGGNFLINDDASLALQGPPRIAADNGSDFLLIWPDNRGGDGLWKFYAASVVDGAPRANLLVDSAQRKAMTTLAAALRLPNDSAMFAWKDYREGHSNIYVRRGDLHGGSFTAAQRINDDSTDRWQRLVVLDSDGHGSIIACWEDHRNTENNQRGDIYLQEFSADGMAVGHNTRVNTRDDRIPRKMPRVAMLRDGSVLVLWHQGEEGAFDLQGQWFRRPGMKQGSSFCLTCGN
jgi:hypothetical protein